MLFPVILVCWLLYVMWCWLIPLGVGFACQDVKGTIIAAHIGTALALLVCSVPFIVYKVVLWLCS